jgi:predicted transcriptional regulator
MTDEWRDRVVQLYGLGFGVNEIAADVGVGAREIREIISAETGATLDRAIKRNDHRYEDTLYAQHQTGRNGRRV